MPAPAFVPASQFGSLRRANGLEAQALWRAEGAFKVGLALARAPGSGGQLPYIWGRCRRPHRYIGLTDSAGPICAGSSGGPGAGLP